MPDVMHDEEQPLSGWALRAVERAPAVERSRRRSAQRAKQVVDAARRLVADKGSDFTTHELVKEAGIAVQTLYKHFPSKDHVILAVLEDMVAESAADYEQRAASMSDPVARLRSHVVSIIGSLTTGGGAGPDGRFVAAEHWRLAQLYPDELTRVTRPVSELIRADLAAAAEAGLLQPADPAFDAWLATQLLVAVFHHYTFAASIDVADLSERVWGFCWSAWGGGRSEITS